MLARIQLPKRFDTTGGSVSCAAMTAVLRAIDDHAHSPERDQPLTISAARDERGTVQPGIAERIGKSDKTTRRAVKALGSILKLVDVERYTDRHGRRRNRYLIHWSRIKVWIECQTHGGVDIDAWIESVKDTDHDNDPAGHSDRSQPVMVTVTTGHSDRSQPVTMTASTTTHAHFSHSPPPVSMRAVGEGREAVAAAMADLEVASITPAIDAALGRGTTIEHLNKIIDHYREHSEENGWTAGALRTAIHDAAPGIPIDVGWPPPSRQAQQRQQRLVFDEEAAQRRQQADAGRERQRKQAAEREREFGPVWDAMPLEDQMALARSIGPYIATRCGDTKHGPKSRSVRQIAIAELAKRAGQEGAK